MSHVRKKSFRPIAIISSLALLVVVVLGVSYGYSRKLTIDDFIQSGFAQDNSQAFLEGYAKRILKDDAEYLNI